MPDDAGRAPGERDTPTCRRCHRSERVRDVAVYSIDPGVQYWMCDRCGYVWGTRDDQDVAATAARCSRIVKKPSLASSPTAPLSGSSEIAIPSLKARRACHVYRGDDER